MLLLLVLLTLPLFFIFLIGALLIFKPQKEVLKQIHMSYLTIKPGTMIQTTNGLQGHVLSSTKTHVILAALDGQKYQILKHSIKPYETSL
ncbi:preprotein translocase subunit YajC [Candidatus Dependentiae bacterium]|nr:preprotein translocase subunit YajC [Candidatus Dependentiae bacterium]